MARPSDRQGERRNMVDSRGENGVLHRTIHRLERDGMAGRNGTSLRVHGDVGRRADHQISAELGLLSWKVQECAEVFPKL